MAKSVNDLVLDAALDVVALSNVMVACSAEPTTRTEAVTTYALADIAMTPGDGNGDFTIADDTSGRKLTMTAKSTVDIDVSDTATHIALCDGTNLYYVTTCTSQALTDTGTVDFPTWKINIADPT